jgi:Uma2 family endonuclease
MTAGPQSLSRENTGPVDEALYYSLGEDSPWEYLDGRLVRRPPSERRSDLFGFFITLLGLYLDVRGGGEVRGSRYPMRLDERWSAEPDLMVVREENVGRMKDRYLDGPADWVIEIASEDDPQFEQREKLPRYREAHLPEVWLIDRFAELVRVETLASHGYEGMALHEGRLASTVVPGFRIETDWLWRPKLPSTVDCLRTILPDLTWQ